MKWWSPSLGQRRRESSVTQRQKVSVEPQGAQASAGSWEDDCGGDRRQNGGVSARRDGLGNAGV